LLGTVQIYQRLSTTIIEPSALPVDMIRAPKEAMVQSLSSHTRLTPTLHPTTTSSIPPSTENLPQISNGADRCELSGVISFERIEFSEAKSGIETNYQLQPFDPVSYPSRYIEVNLRDRQHKVLATTRTDSRGQYFFEVSDCASNRWVYLELVAAINIKGIDPASTRGITSTVYDHTSTNARYTVTSDHYFTLTAGINTQDILLGTGFDRIDGFKPATSQSQPFAILDSLVKGFEMLKNHGIDIPANAKSLKVVWSRGAQANVTAGGYYNPADNLIFIRGSVPVDGQERPKTTNSEWNEHVILHEFGHWYSHQVIGRSDSHGGNHSGFMFSDLPLALDESIAGAIARMALNDWQDKRAASDINQVINAKNFNAIINKQQNQLQRHVRHFTHSNGQPYNRPAFEFSPFDETSNMLFLLSLMDNRAQFSDLATTLANRIGFIGLHHSLQRAAAKPDPLTIYSVGEQLINDNPLLAGELILLAKALNIAIETGSCGESQWPLSAHVIDDGGRLLDDEALFPICSELALNDQISLSFSGALQSPSSARPGTVRYVYFTPPYDATVTFTAANILDSEDVVHAFSFDVTLIGEQVSSSRYVKSAYAYQSRLTVIGDQRYVIRIIDRAYRDPSYKSEETLTMILKVDLN